MQRPTLNPITQTAHLPSQAVDYAYLPDPTIYAPEDGTIQSYAVAGPCGNNLRLRRGDHYHSFCHLERPLVSVGQSVKRGQAIGIMGYTGLTDPDDVPEGRHLHHFIRYDNGTYVYPPSIVNESFITLGEEMISDKEDERQLFLDIVGRNPYPQEVGRYVGKSLQDARVDLRKNNDRTNINKMVDAYYKNNSQIPVQGQVLAPGSYVVKG